MFNGIVIFLCVKKDKTAVQCSADVLVSLSKYVARGGKTGPATNKNYRNFPKSSGFAIIEYDRAINVFCFL